MTHGAIGLYRLRLAAGEATPTFCCDQPRLFIWYAAGDVVVYQVGDDQKWIFGF